MDWSVVVSSIPSDVVVVVNAGNVVVSGLAVVVVVVVVVVVLVVVLVVVVVVVVVVVEVVEVEVVTGITLEVEVVLRDGKAGKS